MRSTRGSTLVKDLLTLGSLAPVRDPNALCALILSACRARAVLLFSYDRRDQSWQLQACSGLDPGEQAVAASEWRLPPPSAWRVTPGGMSIPSAAGSDPNVRGRSLPSAPASMGPGDVRVAHNDDATRLLLLQADPADEGSTLTASEWELADRILGLLLRQWELQDDLTDQERTLEQNRTNLVALLDILNSVSRVSPINDLYESTVDVLQKITHADAVVLRRYDEVNECLHLVAERGLSADLRAKIQCVAERPVFIEMLRGKRAGVRPTVNPEAWDLGYVQAISVPLVASERVVGTVSLLDRSGLPPSVDELRWLEVLGRCVALMIHQVHQAEAQRERAVLEERSHLAREIHDGFAQSLAALQLLIAQQRSALEAGDVKAALDVSGRLSLLAEDAYTSVREEILALHDEATFEGGLRGFLERYLPRFERQWGIECRAEFEPPENDAAPPNLHPAVQSQLTRIIQESLANVRKHAHAGRVCVRVQSRATEVQVSVEDDGSGFDMERIPAEAYGIRIMQERAISVGGAITFRSTQEHGTVLEVVVPANRAVAGGESP
jgi:nitrate/nitrite-specific signal transduction histidine kinase